jgi:hypothetical protein
MMHLGLVVDDHFAIRKAAAAQLVYLVFYSYTFFFNGYVPRRIEAVSKA